MRIGIVGYGVGGKYFHAPFIQAAEGIRTLAVLDAARRSAAEGIVVTL